MNILDLEEDFSKKYIKLFNNLNKLLDEIVKYGRVDLKNNNVSKAILIRLKYYYDYQDNIKTLLNKRNAPSTADFFVGTVVFYFKAVFRIYNLPFEVYSEREIIQKKGAIRPDISIWLGNNIVAIIECKTQLGWSRNDWKIDFIEREKKLKKEYPEALAFLLVVTSLNWGGFGNDNNVGKKYFCLSNEWPSKIDLNRLDSYLLNPIEPILIHFIEKNNKQKASSIC